MKPNTTIEEKEYNILECGCKYSIDNYGYVVYCKNHHEWEEIGDLIGRDLKSRLIAFIKEDHDQG